MLDFWGTKVTPGHVCLCGDGPYEGQHRMLIDIIRDDGAMVRADGTLIRASTNCEVGSDGDRLINILWRTDKDSTVRQGWVRAGAIPAESKRGDMTYMDILSEGGYTLLSDGNVVRDGEEPHPLGYWGELPKPEDYLLKRSELTLEELYSEDITLQGDEFSLAFTDGNGNTGNEVPATGYPALEPVLQAEAPSGNRQERRRQKAIQRKHGGETIH
ncbi:MAG: hypothetical protein GKS01_19345 [Alphaproteobacteria bacterium]|nr:hypothetical protein [Alphaproteobacteria bacterium]